MFVGDDFIGCCDDGVGFFVVQFVQVVVDCGIGMFDGGQCYDQLGWYVFGGNVEVVQ